MSVVRYDDADGGFHRHYPGFPEPQNRRISLAHIDYKQMLTYARNEIKEQYLNWEQQIMKLISVALEGAKND